MKIILMCLGLIVAASWLFDIVAPRIKFLRDFSVFMRRRKRFEAYMDIADQWQQWEHAFPEEDDYKKLVLAYAMQILSNEQRKEYCYEMFTYHQQYHKDEAVRNFAAALGIETADISDGYHSFRDLYRHRIELYLALCGMFGVRNRVWYSHKHSDGSQDEGWFVLGIDELPGEQITYHLPDEYLGRVSQYQLLDVAPAFDGHTSEDVLSRIRGLKPGYECSPSNGEPSRISFPPGLDRFYGAISSNDLMMPLVDKNPHI